MIDYTGTGCASGCEVWAHQDRLGSTVMTTDHVGVVLDSFTYSPYGESTTGFPFRFTGQKLDPETGLYYYKARYYDPKTGRFLQTDPIGYEDQMNLYSYVGNDPLNNTDPTGEATFTFSQEVRVSIPFVGSFKGEIGLAFSIPDPVTGGDFDVGTFFSFSGPVTQEGYTGSANYGFGGKIVRSVGVHRGGVRDLRGSSAEVTVQIPITPIPGTPIPNPIGPSVGGAALFDLHPSPSDNPLDSLTGVKLSIGVGSEFSGSVGYTYVVSLRDILKEKKILPLVERPHPERTVKSNSSKTGQ